MRNEGEKELARALSDLIKDGDFRKKLAKEAVGVRKKNSTKVVLGEWKKIIQKIRGARHE